MSNLGTRLLREQEGGFLGALRDAGQLEIGVVQQAFHADEVKKLDNRVQVE